ncbi:aldo/keto reductase [Nonomuraea sp. NPDC046802]|uniref:aldo/keto reductase n=1 Tax=Nonomuraea sp. NPDC046802 TaxID=3154919 RepID=UPI0033EDBB22
MKSLSELTVFPLCLGGNVFGWTADRTASFAILDAYAEAGGNFIDTADMYCRWVPGNSGGESEAIIGEWMAVRGNRDRMVIATKVGILAARKGLSFRTIRAAAEDSLRRLRTDYIDLYFAHEDDLDTPQEETMSAFDSLVREGKVRVLGASNFSAARLASALAVSDREGLARYAVLQQHYNLVERAYEGELRVVVQREGLASLPYFGLAQGFLTGKYRAGANVDSPRAAVAAAYLVTEQGRKTLQALETVADRRQVEMAAVALAWLAARPTVVAPIASARIPDQLKPLLTAVGLRLSAEEVRLLDEASC